MLLPLLAGPVLALSGLKVFLKCLLHVQASSVCKLGVIIRRLSDIDLSTQLCVMRYGASVGGPCLMPQQDKVEADAWVIFQEPFRCSAHRPGLSKDPKLITAFNVYRWTKQLCGVNNITFGVWIDYKGTACWETSRDDCGIFLCFSVSLSHGAGFVAGENLWERDAILTFWAE